MRHYIIFPLPWPTELNDWRETTPNKFLCCSTCAGQCANTFVPNFRRWLNVNIVFVACSIYVYHHLTAKKCAVRIWLVIGWLTHPELSFTRSISVTDSLQNTANCDKPFSCTTKPSQCWSIKTKHNCGNDAKNHKTQICPMSIPCTVQMTLPWGDLWFNVKLYKINNVRECQ